jgi:aminoglycoside phosphotransferase (APT) family kinase protein
VTIEGHNARDNPDGAALALLRATPPPEALQWVAKVTGASSVKSVERMRGGSSAAMHRVRVHIHGGGVGELVLRRYIRPDPLAATLDVARHEAAVLELVGSMATPTPRLVACDPTGESAGVPAVLMTALHGQPAWTFDLRWMRQMVEVLIDVHDVAVAPWVRPLQPYEQTSYALPTSSRSSDFSTFTVSNRPPSKPAETSRLFSNAQS